MHIVKKYEKKKNENKTSLGQIFQTRQTTASYLHQPHNLSGLSYTNWFFKKKKNTTSEEKTVTVTRNTKNERVDTISRKLICSEESTLGEVVRLKRVHLISGESG